MSHNTQRCVATTYSPDRSSVHPNIQYRLLDWFDAISAQENLKSLLVEAHADIILGADIVSRLLSHYYRLNSVNLRYLILP